MSLRNRCLSIALLAAAQLAQAQFQAPPAPPRPASAKDAAPEDITGYWVSIVTEDWRWRMLTPAKGDYTSLPLNPEGRKVADTWDPAKDTAAGNPCKGYGAAGLMRLPTRLHITWQDNNTMKLETDEGTQTRLFHFAAKAPTGQAPSLQGYSLAEWDISRPTNMGFQPPPAAAGKLPGSLKVVTTSLKPGYLRKNGVPYSGNAVLTEYFTRTHEPNGDSWLILTSIVDDSQYLTSELLTSTHYKREADGSKWDPSPCVAK
ncbi:MAG TPA: hypothetical protein VLY24_25455 [Bryobacteraceae bacterium]|nr:hypothetical protein [Bryobacteraceae bacterium]